MQLWDLDDIIQASGKTAKSSLAVDDSDSDSDSDEMNMDVDTSAPKSNRGISTDLCTNQQFS